jgi:hypothetical protein
MAHIVSNNNFICTEYCTPPPCVDFVKHSHASDLP